MTPEEQNGKPMAYLPWRIVKGDPRLIIDNTGCHVVDLRIWGSVGQGHNAQEIAQLIVQTVNREDAGDDPEITI
jgi:glutamate-1-semialdehyde aminotransferase